MSDRVIFVRCSDPDLHERVRVQAAHQDLSIQDYALRALRFVVEWDEDERRIREPWRSARRALATGNLDYLRRPADAGTVDV